MQSEKTPARNKEIKIRNITIVGISFFSKHLFPEKINCRYPIMFALPGNFKALFGAIRVIYLSELFFDNPEIISRCVINESMANARVAPTNIRSIINPAHISCC